MTQIKKSLGILGVILSLFWLAACSSPTPTSTPTQDLNPFRTEIASTVLAQVTRDLALTPSVTPIPSLTATLLPTSTATQEASPLPSATVTLLSGTPGTGTENLAEWVSQTVADDTTFAPGESFTMSWRVKNVGTSTWTEAYLFRFFSGDTFGAPNEVQLGQEVLPGAIFEITLQMKAPTVPGRYNSNWVFSSENRSNFKQGVFLQILVAAPATPSPTP